jgi:hypothetical protein
MIMAAMTMVVTMIHDLSVGAEMAARNLIYASVFRLVRRRGMTDVVDIWSAARVKRQRGT